MLIILKYFGLIVNTYFPSVKFLNTFKSFFGKGRSIKAQFSNIEIASFEIKKYIVMVLIVPSVLFVILSKSEAKIIINK